MFRLLQQVGCFYSRLRINYNAVIFNTGKIKTQNFKLLYYVLQKQIFPASRFLQHQTEFLLLPNTNLWFSATVSKLHTSACYFNSLFCWRFNCDVPPQTSRRFLLWVLHQDLRDNIRLTTYLEHKFVTRSDPTAHFSFCAIVYCKPYNCVQMACCERGKKQLCSNISCVRLTVYWFMKFFFAI